MEIIKIDRTNWMEIILQDIPAFAERWEEHIAAWFLPLERPIAIDVAEFADFAIDAIHAGEDAEIERIAAAIELMLLAGDPIVSYAFQTLFLEQIAYRAHKLEFSVDRFVARLQPLGYYYWQDLDRRLSIYPAGSTNERSFDG